MGVVHIPVMPGEVLEALRIKNTGIYVDATVGLGGHAEGVLKEAKGCTLIGIDKDDKAIEVARERLKKYHVHLIRDNFSNMKAIVNGLGYDKVDGIILDLGVSALHLRTEGRGFSFLKDEPLDMRMYQGQKLTASEIVNRYSEKDIASIIWLYGEERFSRRIARAIVKARQKKPINSCAELARIIEKVVGRKSRIHPATRAFQALRIEVNKELAELSAAIDTGAGLLNADGRLCVLSYHSLEDRIVKTAFKKLAKEGIFQIITKGPMVPSRQEKILNPSSRSAKFRVAERI